MRRNRFYIGCGLSLAVLCAIGLIRIPLAQSQVEQKQFTVYTGQGSYFFPVLDRDGKEYVGLSELLQQFGEVRASVEGRKWKLRFNGREAQFTVGKTKARVNKRDVVLSAPPISERGQVLLPFDSLRPILSHLLSARSWDFREQSRRLFLDRAEVRYTPELRRALPSQLIVIFTGPVNPSIATDGGKLRMIFRREPLVSGPSTIALFQDRLISSVTYSEANGTAELLVNGTVPLTASFSPDRKAITITAVPRSPQAVLPLAAPAPAGKAQQVQPEPPPPPTVVVVIDAAHGGTDRGGAITSKLAEKDITLSFARHLYRELDARGIAGRLVRDSDVTITPEQRAVMTNESVPSLYVTLHVTAAGNGVRVFTARLNPTPPSSAFLPWNTAQGAYVGTSQQMASLIATELLKHDVPSVALNTSLHPLSNVAAPAVALEVAAPMNGNVNDLASQNYQQSVCSTIAAAIALNRAKLPLGGAGR